MAVVATGGAGSTVGFMAAGGPENESSIPGKGSCPNPSGVQARREGDRGSFIESHPFLIIGYDGFKLRAWTDARGERHFIPVMREYGDA